MGTITKDFSLNEFEVIDKSKELGINNAIDKGRDIQSYSLDAKEGESSYLPIYVKL